MSLKDTFNESPYSAYLRSATVLLVGNEVHSFFFDFGLRLMTNGAGSSLPFSQLDREVLVEMRDKLVSLGGKPPELPSETPANPGVQTRQPLRP